MDTIVDSYEDFAAMFESAEGRFLGAGPFSVPRGLNLADGVAFTSNEGIKLTLHSMRAIHVPGPIDTQQDEHPGEVGEEGPQETQDCKHEFVIDNSAGSWCEKCGRDVTVWT